MAGIIIVLFCLSLIVVSLFTQKWIKHSEDFLIATREKSFFLTAAGILSIGFASDITSLYSIFSVYYGYFAALVLGVVYFGWMLYGSCFSKLVRSVGTFTISEWYELRFNVNTRLVMSIVFIIALIILGAAGIQGMSQMLYGFLGWPVQVSMIFMLTVIGVIMISGGAWAITITDLLQVILGYILLPAVLIYLVINVGGFNWLLQHVPEAEWRMTFPGHFNLASLGSESYPTWILMWFFALIFGSPYYWLRAAATRSDRAASNGFIAAGLAALPLMVFVVPLLALYPIAMNAEAFLPFGGPVHPAGAFGVLASEINIFLGMFIILGMLAATISTYTTTGLGAVASAVRDIYQRLVSHKATPKEILLPVRLGTLLYLVLTWLTTFAGDVSFLMGVFLAFTGISSVLAVLGAYWRRFTPTGALYAAITGLVLTSIWSWTPALLAMAHQIWITIGSTLIVAILVSLATKPKYYGEQGWKYGDEALNQAPDENIRELSQQEEKILRSILIGANRLADFIDSFQSDGQIVNEIVEKLETEGFIARLAARGANFYHFGVTNKGLNSLSLSYDENEMYKKKLDYRCIQVLRYLKNQPGMLTEEISEALSIHSLELVPLLSALVSNNYLKDTGFLRRKFLISNLGLKLLDEGWVSFENSEKYKRQVEISNNNISIN